MQPISLQTSRIFNNKGKPEKVYVKKDEFISEEKIDLQNTEKALLNILDDYSEEKYHSEDTQRALLNILDDYSEEKINMENTQRAVLNILEDYSEAKEKAEESTKLKEAFLANMSHEIRTPMNAIIGFSDILSKGNLGEKEKEYVRTIKTAGENLLTIINDILDISKIEAGMMTFEEHIFNVKEIFRSLNIMLMGKAKEKNLELIFHCDNEVPDNLIGDSTRLTQIIINLTGNAIKFTQTGSVYVNVKVLKTDCSVTDNQDNRDRNENTVLEFSVKDTGIGIPKDMLKNIFERFRQAESHTTRKYGGTGLGLSIAKQLVELQGGTLSVASEFKVGSVFSFCIQYKKSEETLPAQEITGKKYDMEELSKLNILLIEDNNLNVKLILSLFSEFNLKLQVSENGSLGIEKLKENNFDIILMDMEMPVMNGYQASMIIRNEMKNNIPIIAMTAHAMPGEKEKCMNLGMNDYISKPINANLLFEKMYDLTINKMAKKESEKNVVREDIIVKNICDLNYLSATVGGRKHVIKEIIDTFLIQVPEELQTIKNALAKTDYVTIKRFAHTMRSSVSIFGISSLEPVLQEMENLGATEASADINRDEKLTALNHTLNLICKQAIAEIEREQCNYI